MIAGRPYNLEDPIESNQPRHPIRNKLCRALETWLSGLPKNYGKYTNQHPSDGEHLLYLKARDVIMSSRLRPDPEEAQSMVSLYQSHQYYWLAQGLFLSACFNAAAERVIVYQPLDNQPWGDALFITHSIGYQLPRSKILIVPCNVKCGSIGNESRGITVFNGHAKGGYLGNNGVALIQGNVEQINGPQGAWMISRVYARILSFESQSHAVFLDDPFHNENPHDFSRYNRSLLGPMRLKEFPALREYCEALLNNFSPKVPVQDQIKHAHQLHIESLLGTMYALLEEGEWGRSAKQP